MDQQQMHYAIVKKVSGNYEETVAAITEALKAEGFGILTEIDVKATLKKKLDVDHPKTVILGACNPPLAHKALTAVPDVAVMLPCNVVVRETPEGVEIAALNPMTMAMMIANPELEQVAVQANDRITKAMAAVN